ncbi:uncharacterized protein MAM_00601 [Metarhizium album ARSEF 1941]|uniref:Uncharacterized protein n=1 Tax=Metarhizium album (strain ARSEF 1941) TaxID=1081103 RepID=A0A0B2X7W6_METAS|nr:uncharacterized protein MAM_00601 [Metarhizium album ARSEF 1941]KHO01600.1 hypothetical protein MAM_00601 [Metarhizium album ARSEF 1941]
MHYIRLLRAPRMSVHADGMQAELVFTITTDLGESFLCPEKAIDLAVTAHVTSLWGNSSCLLTRKGALQWKAGRRVCKPVFEFPETIQQAFMSGDTVELCISPHAELSGDEVQHILNSSIKKAARDARGLIVPVWVGMSGPEVEQDMSTRRLRLTAPAEPAQFLEIQEQIGESIARHIWDAGVISLCAIVGAYRFPKLETSQHPCMKKLLGILNDKDGVNVLELGCGVGILGIGLCAVYPRGTAECTILMTDLKEAEGRVRSNMGLLQQLRSGSDLGYAQVMYENLDWNAAQDGGFRGQIQYRRWDLVMLSDCTYNVDMLPALVGTLSAIHRANLEFTPDDDEFSTKVFVATKPRHPSERAFFDLMAAEGWAMEEKQVLSLPVLSGECESVEMYLFEKA